VGEVHPGPPVLPGRTFPPPFSGDHVLPRITPSISVQRADPFGPLQDYLNSLAKVRDLDVEEVLPAHEWRFQGLPERVDAIAAHHERRLAELLAVIRQRPGCVPWELAGLVTSHGTRTPTYRATTSGGRPTGPALPYFNID
jgi:glyoxylase-like metal-dependent hydrolase (beta-lactamase superfamily II)